jgi:hypothetical protein
LEQNDQATSICNSPTRDLDRHRRIAGFPETLLDNR